MFLRDSAIALADTKLDYAPAILDPAHIGDIEGALGTVRLTDDASRRSTRRRLLTFLAIMGPGLIVMVGDNDAGGVQTYTQAGQAYGYSLLWVLALLLPVLVISQEMVARLGAVTGVGHARLIRERFGKTWAAFAVFDLFLLNFLTLLTEFIGVYFGFAYFGVPKLASVTSAGVALFAIATSGKFRWWERFMFALIMASLVFIPAALMAHPRWTSIGYHSLVPGVARGVSGQAILLIVALVGTTVAPWQLFFQQSNIIDKRISPKWLNYERADTVVGGFLTTIAAGAMIIFGASLFHSHRFGSPALYTDSGWFNHAIASVLGPVAGALAAVMLIVASLVGAAAVSLSSSYAFGDSFGSRHSLHRGIRSAPQFYAAYAAQIFLACLVVAVASNSFLGTATQYVQILAGILLPSAVLFLLLLCNDPEVLGPWVNGTATNIATSLIVGVLVVLSADLTIATLFPHIDGVALTEVCFGVAGAAVAVTAPVLFATKRRKSAPSPRRSMTIPIASPAADRAAARRTRNAERVAWRMPELNQLCPATPSVARRASLLVLRCYLIASLLVVGFRAFSPYLR
ncbi:MAG: NRAMP family divalent metal transporter [Acidimicrobiales bacterium]